MFFQGFLILGQTSLDAVGFVHTCRIFKDSVTKTISALFELENRMRPQRFAAVQGAVSASVQNANGKHGKREHLRENITQAGGKTRERD